MKSSLLALIVIGMIHFSANAQEEKKSEFDINYKVCKIGDKYKTCDENTPAFAPEKDNEKAIKKQVAALRKFDEHVYVKSTTQSAKKNPRFTVSYEESAYKGEASMINDGVAKNKARNINYMNTSVELPPVDGNNNVAGK